MAEPSIDQDRSTSAESSDSRRGGPFLWLFALPVLYVLSAGPVGKLDQTLDFRKNLPALEQGLGIIYAPVAWCAGHSKHFRQFMNWYGTVWHIK